MWVKYVFSSQHWALKDIVYDKYLRLRLFFDRCRRKIYLRLVKKEAQCPQYYMIIWISSLLDYQTVSLIGSHCLSVSPHGISINTMAEREYVDCEKSAMNANKVATENSDTCDIVSQAVTFGWKTYLRGGMLLHQIILNQNQFLYWAIWCCCLMQDYRVKTSSDACNPWRVWIPVTAA